jgi:phage shock protein PspC (stress-responsive transcriptional regulator)
MSDYTQQCLIAAIYNLTILFLTTTLVVVFGFSLWWYLGAVLIMASVKKDSQ